MTVAVQENIVDVLRSAAKLARDRTIDAARDTFDRDMRMCALLEMLLPTVAPVAPAPAPQTPAKEPTEPAAQEAMPAGVVAAAIQQREPAARKVATEPTGQRLVIVTDPHGSDMPPMSAEAVATFLKCAVNSVRTHCAPSMTGRSLAGHRVKWSDARHAPATAGEPRGIWQKPTNPVSPIDAEPLPDGSSQPMRPSADAKPCHAGESAPINMHVTGSGERPPMPDSIAKKYLTGDDIDNRLAERRTEQAQQRRRRQTA